MEIEDLRSKIENRGASSKGKLGADEWNTLVEALIGLKTLGGHTNVSKDADGGWADDVVLWKGQGETTWKVKKLTELVPAVDSQPQRGSTNAVSSGGVYVKLRDIENALSTLESVLADKAPTEALDALDERLRDAEQQIAGGVGSQTLGGLQNVNEDADAAVSERMVMCKDPDSDEWVMVPASQFGGGGSASTTQYQLRVVNNLDTKSLVASKGEACLVSYTFTSQSRESSDDPWGDTGERGYCVVAVRNTGTYKTVWEGYIDSNAPQSLNVANHLAAGSNAVKISIEGEDSGMSAASLVYQVTLTELSVSAPNFTWWTPFSGNIVVPLIISGNIKKTLHIAVTGTDYGEVYERDLGTDVYTSNALNHEIPAPTVPGVYNVAIWLTNADGTLVTSRISYNIIYAPTDDPGKYICVNDIAAKATNWAENTLLAYSIYDGGKATTTATVLVTTADDTVYRTTLSGVQTGAAHSFSLPLEVDTADNSDFDIIVLISDDAADIVWQTVIPVDNSTGYSAMAGADFILNPKTRSNQQDNAEVIINEADGQPVPATWQNMNGYNDRWVERPGEGRVLRLMAGSSVDIDYKPFATESARTGRTLEIDYICENVTDYDEAIIRILTEVGQDFIGLKINPDWFTLHSSAQKSELDDNQGLYIEDGERVRFTLTIVPDAYGNRGFNLAKIYINGCVNREFTYASNDYWVNNSPIRIGSGNADIDIFGLRVYNFALSEGGVRRNVQNWLPTTAEKAAFGDANDIFEANGTDISIDKMIAKGGWVFVWRTEVPSYTNPNKMTADLEIYYQGELYATIKGVPCSGQGTTSMKYFFWNLRWKLKGCTVVYADGSTTVGYIRFPWYDLNVEDLVAKLNFASPMQSHKMGSVNMLNDLADKLGISDDIGARLAIEQRPCVIFTRITNSEGVNVDTFCGPFTYGPHKGNKPTMGYNRKSDYPDMLSVEGADNGPLLTLHRVPWDDRISYNSEQGAIMRNGEKSWGYNAGAYADDDKSQEANVKTLFDRIFKPAYDAVHTNSPRIRPFAGTIDELNAAVNTYKGDTMEYWTPAGNLYYYDSATGRYVSDDGINLYEQLVDKGYGLSSQDIADAADNEALNALFINARKVRFKQQYGQYWNVRSALLWICFMRFFASTDTRAKNTYWKIFLSYLDGGRLTAFFDDLDTIFDFTNQGQPLKEYYVEEGDTYADGSDVWNGMTNNMPNLIEATYVTELTDMMREMMAAMEELSGLQTGSHFDKLYACVKKYYFDWAQEYFPAALYNAATRVIYEAAKLAYMAGTYKNDTDPITQALGNHYSSEKRWVKKRIVYVMSKYSYGDFAASSTTDMISVRMGGGLHTFDIVPAIAMYPNIANGQSIIRGGRTMPGETCHFEVETNGDQQINIYGAGYLKSIGDWHRKLVKGDMAVSGRMLSELILGSADDEVAIAISGLTLSDTVSLRRLVLTNISTLSGVLDLSVCSHIREVYATGTALTQISLPSGGALQHIEYPDTNQYIQLHNFPLLQTDNVVVGDGPSVIDFFVDNCPQLDAFSILLQIFTAQESLSAVNLKHIRITGVNSTINSSMLDAIAHLADGRFAGLDADGLASEAYPLPVLQGTLTVEGAYYEDSMAAIQQAFPDLVINAVGSPYVRFEDSRVLEICAYRWGYTEDLKETDGQGGILASGMLQGNDDTLVYSDYMFAATYAIGAHGSVPATAARTVQYRVEIVVEGGRALDGENAPWDIATASAVGNAIFYPVQYGTTMSATALGTITAENWADPTFWASQTILTDGGAVGANAHKYTALITTTNACQYLRLGIRAVAGTNISWKFVSVGVTKLPQGITQAQCSAVSSLGTVFQKNSTIITLIDMLNLTSVTSLSSSAFSSLSNAVYGTVPPSVTVIPHMCFEYSGMSEIIIPEGVRRHDYRWNYRECTKLKVLVLPSTTTTVTMEFCYGDTSLVCVIIKATTPPGPDNNMSSASMFSRASSAYRIYVPDDSVDDYKASSVWSGYSSRILGKSSLPEEYQKYWED